MFTYKRSTNKRWELGFDNLKFVLEARGLKSVGVLLRLHVRESAEGRRIEACDGHRAHQWACGGFFPELTPGCYRVVNNTQRKINLESEEGPVAFPDLDRVLPPEFFTSPAPDATVNFGAGSSDDPPAEWAGAIREIAQLIPAASPFSFNWHFFSAFQSYWGVKYADASSLLLFDEERGLRAAIMPLRFKP